MRLAPAVLIVMLSACGGPHHTQQVAGRELCDAWASDAAMRPYFEIERVVIRATDRFEPPRCTYSIDDAVTLAVVHDGAGVARWERDGDLLIAHVEHVVHCESCPETCQAVSRRFEPHLPERVYAVETTGVRRLEVRRTTADLRPAEGCPRCGPPPLCF